MNVYKGLKHKIIISCSRVKTRGKSLLKSIKYLNCIPRAKEKIKDERSFLENSRSRRIARGNSLNCHELLNSHEIYLVD
jgi:hypothetical protein